MGPRLDVPETDPRFGAGTRICEHLEGIGIALTEDEKDGLAHIIAEYIKSGRLEALAERNLRHHHLVVAGVARVDELQLTAPPPQNFKPSRGYEDAAEALGRLFCWGRDYDTSIMGDFELDAVLRMGVPPVSPRPCGGGGTDYIESKSKTALDDYKATGEKFRMCQTRPKNLNLIFRWEPDKDYSWKQLWLSILYAIEQRLLRGQRRVDGVESPRRRADATTEARRVDGVGRPKFDFHTDKRRSALASEVAINSAMCGPQPGG